MTKGAKRALRPQLLDARARLTAADRAAASAAIGGQLLGVPAVAAAATVAAYWPFGTEPSPVGALTELHARGVRVLLPVGREDGDLDWAPYQSPDELAAGRWRFAEPTGPSLGVDELLTADVVLVPALAVDASGGRLGRGSGSYDRALARVAPSVPLIAIVYDEEVLDAVPMEPHDRRVSVIVTPLRVLVV